jgi:Fic family protein
MENRGVAIFKGDEVKHLAPPANRVPLLMENLFKFIIEDNQLTWLLKACIFHYEWEFIHPFSDGNGRMGRLWQQLLLMKEDPVFRYIPIEVMIKENQAVYYNVLGDSTPFIEFSLQQILISLNKYTKSTTSMVADPETRIQYAKNKLGMNWFSRKNYMEIHKNISTSTASRDLQYGHEKGFLIKLGEKNQIRYKFT